MHVFRHLLILSSLLLVAKGQMMRFVKRDPKITKDSETAKRKWDNMEKVLKNVVNEIIRNLYPVAMDNAQNLNISSTCMREAVQIVGGLKNIKPWALRLLDSSVPSPGLITGTVTSFGAYDECLDTIVYNERPGKAKGKVMFTGKYCLLRISAYLPPRNQTVKHGDVMEGLKETYGRGTVLSEAAKMVPYLYWRPARLGVCVPSGCSLDDINQVTQMVSDQAALHVSVGTCDVRKEPKYTSLMIFVITFFSFTGFVVLVASLTDFYIARYGNKPRGKSLRVLLAFSLISNFHKLVDTSTESSTLRCLDGIRFFTMSWIVLAHFYFLIGTHIMGGLLYMKQILQNDFAFQVIANATVAVDTFFFIGGFIMCYNATKRVVVGRSNFSVKLHILRRIWRILPTLVYVVLYTFIAELTATGPIAQDIFKPWVGGCRKYWWKTVLFINNLHGHTEGCLPHTWYLAADMQLYIASLIILLPLFRWPKVGISVAATLVVTCFVGIGVQLYVSNLPPTYYLWNFDVDTQFRFDEQHYVMPHTHAPVYIVGLMTGYLLATRPNLRIPRVVQLCGWCCAIIASMSVLYGTFEWHQGRQITLAETLFYGCFHRVAWSLSIAWMVFCCATGRGGIVNDILSWKMWIPLGRLTYTSYLVHASLLVSLIASARISLLPRHDFLVCLFLGCLAMTCGIAFVTKMLVESPFLAIEDILLPKRSDEKKNKEKERGKTDSHISPTVEDHQVHKNSHSNLSVQEHRKWSENEGFVYRL